jgi:type IV pilus assembly protein PilW
VQLAPVALIEGVDAIRYELGIDNVSKTGAAVDFTQAIIWVDPSTKKQPTNRGDGSPDTFVRCTTAAPCTVAQLMNVVAVKIYVLARGRETVPGYTDTKTYCLGEPAADGSCPTASQIAAANDHYQRHVFTTSVRLTNISGRRETPT